MTFPETPLGLRGELQIGGSWVDVTRHIYTRDPIRTTAGMSAQGTGVDPSSLELTLNNRDGRYSPRNPLSPYYGKLGRNTPVRLTVPGGETRLDIGTGAGSVASTPSTGLPTGDIDLRIDLTPGTWDPTATYELIGRYAAVDGQRSFLFVLAPGGVPRLFWSADGATNRSASTEAVSMAVGARTALRVTLDVDNGAGGVAVTFYRAPTMAGPWRQIGAPTVSAGVTSLYPSTTPLEVGDAAKVAWVHLPGAVHAVEVRSGIDGTPAVRADFTTATPDAATFTDSTARVWTVAGEAAFADRATLFHGEVSSWPSRWAPSGQDVWVSIEAAGILRRMQQGRKALSSTLRRRIPSGRPVAYWPMEEGDTATQAYSPVAGVRPLRTTLLDFAADDSLPGSDPLPTLTVGSTIAGTVPAYTSSGAWQFEMAYRLGAEPTLMMPMLEFVTRSTVWPRLSLQLGPGGGVNLVGTNVDGDATTLLVIGTSAPIAGQWTRLRLQAEQDGSNVKLTLLFVPIGGTGGQWVKTYAGTVGPLKSFSGGYGSAYDGMAIGHIAVFGAANVGVFNFADHGYNNETAGARASRLAGEEGVPLTIMGDAAATAAMGPQTSQTLVDLLHECAEADGGILMEQSRVGLTYRTRTSLYNQAPVLVLDYAAGHLGPPLEPVEDDQAVRNDVTVNRTGGGSGRTVVESGPLSTLPPELGGVGIYDESIDLNLATDEQAEPMAAWLAHLGTWDEPRFPSIRVQLHRHPELIPAVLRLKIGDRVRITGLPLWVGAPTMDIHVMQIQHEPRPRAWDLTLVGTPAGPYQVGMVDDVARADTSGSVLAAAATSTATTLSVATAVGPVWVTDLAEFPFDLTVGGEVVTVTDVVGAVADRFERSATGGWGTATSGQVWMTTGGPSSDYSVQGG